MSTKPCPVCTYENVASRSVCEICESVLEGTAAAARTAPAPSRAPSMVRHEIAADNSCLFNAVGYLCEGAHRPDMATELRGTIAAIVLTDPDKYSEGVLGRPVADYVEYIQRPEKWGGGLELEILSVYYACHFVAVDIVTCKAFRFGSTSCGKCAYLLFSGTHYDAVVRQHPDGRVETTFGLEDIAALEGAQALATEAHGRGAFTDLNNFTLLCQVCHQGVVGQEGAVAHAKATGHVNFGEYVKPKH